MPGIYKLFTAIVAFIGNVSLIATGEMNPAFSIFGTGLLWGYYRSMKGYQALSKWVLGGLSLTTFLVFLINFYMTGEVFIAVAHLTLIFQTLKSFDIKEPWDPLQVFFVSLLQLLIASELTNSISFGIVFLVFLVFIVVSILLGHFVREGKAVFRPYVRPVALITLFTLILTVVFFVTIPRFRSGLWGKSFLKGINTAGFSEKVDFGSFGEVKLDETVVMRVIMDTDSDGPLYLRGMTFDYFDGTSWNDTIRDMRRYYRTSRDFGGSIPEESGIFETEILLEPMDSDVIFTFKKPYRIDSAGYYMRRDSAGSFYMRHKKSKRFNYRMYSVDEHYRDNVYLKSYLQFPEEMGQVRRLAHDVTTQSSDDLDKVNRIRGHLSGNYRYSLSTDHPADGSSAVEHFLFTSLEGYCEHFATSMTLMVRSLGIPARLVTGFLSGSKNTFGDYYLVRQSDAHSWVEAFVNGRWILFDPTPPVIRSKRFGFVLLLDMVNMNWNRYVVGFSAYDQVRMSNYLLGSRRRLVQFPDIPLGWFVFATLIAGILFGLMKKLRRISIGRNSGVSAEYVKFRKMVSRFGGRVTLSSTSKEVYGEALKTGRFDLKNVQRFIDSYQFLRFSDAIDSGLKRKFYSLAKQLRKSKE
jgi:transglutaminase-like putative cysteine protease